MQTPRIPFAIEEVGIVGAAVKLGDWVLSQKGLTESQRSVVRKLQRCLIEGVFAPPGEYYDFGFKADRADLNRSWCVYLQADEYLEIFSSYNPYPPYDEQDRDYLRDHPGEMSGPVFWHMVGQEDWFMWRVGQPHDTYKYDVSRWISEVANPDKYRFEGFSVEPEVDDPEDKGDPHIQALWSQVKVWTDENRVIHVEYPPELQAMFDAAEGDFVAERELQDRRLQELRSRKKPTDL